MSAVATEVLHATRPARTVWAVLVGLLALYVPTYFDLYETFWSTGRSVQGPVILGWVAWLLWRERAALALQATCGRSPAAVALFVFGLLCYALGRSQALDTAGSGLADPGAHRARVDAARAAGASHVRCFRRVHRVRDSRSRHDARSAACCR